MILRMLLAGIDPAVMVQALEDIQAAYPDREVIGIYTKEIIFGGGNIHCITQQQPKARKRVTL